MELLPNRQNIRIADPRAPRFTVEKFGLTTFSNHAFFKAMKKQHPELEKYNERDIAKCINLFNIRISNEVISNKNGVRLPNGLGIIVAGAYKMPENVVIDTSKYIDYGKSKKSPVNVPFQNLHSDVYIAKIKYSNEIDKHMFENHDLWMFDPCRRLKSAITAEFKKGNQHNYILFNTYEHIAHLFRKQKIEKIKTNDVYRKKKLDEHDEFAF